MLCAWQVVHQHEHPSYRIECRQEVRPGKKPPPPPRDIHLSYHDGEHYNSVRPLRRAGLKEDRPGGGGSSSSAGNSFSALGDASVAGGAEGDAAETGDAGLAESASSLAIRDDGSDEADGDVEGGGGESGRAKSKANRAAAKVSKKEEKQRRKAEKHREAIMAAGGDDDEVDRAPAESAPESGVRGVIVL